WWNKTITYQVDLSKIRLLTVGFAGLPLSVKAPTVSAAETEEKKVSDNPIMKSLHSFKEITGSVWDGMKTRSEKSTDSWYDFADYLSGGLVDGTVDTWNGMQSRYVQFKEEKSMSSFLHYITMGADDMVVGTVNPKE
ncbi:hypothetical protein, partial [Metabacillus lacus]|uniref:hypothetical protein n=1 Tax=Metabacillus lacus TaxID=1983721 RepID=UPI001478C2A8